MKAQQCPPRRAILSKLVICVENGLPPLLAAGCDDYAVPMLRWGLAMTYLLITANPSLGSTLSICSALPIHRLNTVSFR
jgi:hypothetical protein